MKVIKFYLSCLLFLSPIGYADTILVLGDSLSAAYQMDDGQGWVQLLANEFEEHRVINASISGETTGGGLTRLPRLLEEIEPDWVLIELGGNDGLRGYPLQTIRSNLQDIIVQVQSSGAIPVLMEIRIPPNYGERYSEAFVQIYRELAAANEIFLIDFILEDIALNTDLMLEDGIHPTPRSQPIIKDLVAASLEEFMAREQP